MSSYNGSMENVRIIAGRSNLELANSIAGRANIPIINCHIENFQNGEIGVEITESVRNRDIFIVQTGYTDENNSINDYFMELIAIVDACTRSSAGTVSVVIPFYLYSRSDKKDAPRVPIMASVITSILENMGVHRIISMDLHSGQIQGFTNRVAFDNLFAINIFIDHLNETIFKDLTQEKINEKYIVICPDAGAYKRTSAYAKRMGMYMAAMQKERDYTKKSHVSKSMLVGDPDKIMGKTAIIIDDMIDTMGTMVAAADELIGYGIKSIIIIATHGLFSGPALERIQNCDHIEKIIVTDTVPQLHNIRKVNKIQCVSVDGLFANVIKNLIEGGSISELFS
jgi:ribose-phosphate pyrophosphokinase